MTDITLDLPDLVVPQQRPTQTIQERFDAFHRANPWVYAALALLAFEAHESGRKRVGIKHLTEIVRWQYERGTSDREFKLDNRYTSRYARLIMAEHPELEGLFETRRLRAA